MIPYKKTAYGDYIQPGKYQATITNVKPVEGARMVEFTLRNGQSFPNRYTLKDNSNRALDVLINTVLVGSGHEVDLTELIGKQVSIEVHHTEYNGMKYPGVKWVYPPDHVSEIDEFNDSDDSFYDLD